MPPATSKFKSKRPKSAPKPEPKAEPVVVERKTTYRQHYPMRAQPPVVAPLRPVTPPLAKFPSNTRSSYQSAFCHPSGRGADELSEVSDSELELSELVQQSKSGKAVRPVEASAKAADVDVVVKEEAHVLARPSIKFTAQSSYQHDFTPPPTGSYVRPRSAPSVPSLSPIPLVVPASAAAPSASPAAVHIVVPQPEVTPQVLKQRAWAGQFTWPDTQPSKFDARTSYQHFYTDTGAGRLFVPAPSKLAQLAAQARGKTPSTQSVAVPLVPSTSSAFQPVSTTTTQQTESKAAAHCVAEVATNANVSRAQLFTVHEHEFGGVPLEAAFPQRSPIQGACTYSDETGKQPVPFSGGVPEQRRSVYDFFNEPKSELRTSQLQEASKPQTPVPATKADKVSPVKTEPVKVVKTESPPKTEHKTVQKSEPIQPKTKSPPKEAQPVPAPVMQVVELESDVEDVNNEAEMIDSWYAADTIKLPVNAFLGPAVTIVPAPIVSEQPSSADHFEAVSSPVLSDSAPSEPSVYTAPPPLMATSVQHVPSSVVGAAIRSVHAAVIQAALESAATAADTATLRATKRVHSQQTSNKSQTEQTSVEVVSRPAPPRSVPTSPVHAPKTRATPRSAVHSQSAAALPVSQPEVSGKQPAMSDTASVASSHDVSTPRRSPRASLRSTASSESESASPFVHGTRSAPVSSVKAAKSQAPKAQKAHTPKARIRVRATRKVTPPPPPSLKLSEAQLMANAQSLYQRGSEGRPRIAFAHQWLDGELRVAPPPSSLEWRPSTVTVPPLQRSAPAHRPAPAPVSQPPAFGRQPSLGNAFPTASDAARALQSHKLQQKQQQQAAIAAERVPQSTAEWAQYRPVKKIGAASMSMDGVADFVSTSSRSEGVYYD